MGIREAVSLYRHGGGTTERYDSKRVRMGRWLGIFLRGLDQLFLCGVLERHEPATYYQGWGDVPGSLVHWICSRCRCFRHWGYYKDGPRGPAYPKPTQEEQRVWEEWGKGLRLMQEREGAARAAIPVPGQCTAHWATNRCTREPGHSGPHGIQMPGFVLAPWPNENEVALVEKGG